MGHPLKRLLIASLAVNLVLGLAAVGWVTWIVIAPKYWFPGAYAGKGERGDRGPRGPVGPLGPAGPVGPDAADAIYELEGTLDDLSVRLDDLEAGSGTSELQYNIDSVDSKVEDICDALLYSEIEPLNDIYYNAC
jgi:hypothetical protein